jgi:hypothetical protein
MNSFRTIIILAVLCGCLVLPAFACGIVAETSVPPILAKGDPLTITVSEIRGEPVLLWLAGRDACSVRLAMPGEDGTAHVGIPGNETRGFLSGPLYIVIQENGTVPAGLQGASPASCPFNPQPRLRQENITPAPEAVSLDPGLFAPGAGEQDREGRYTAIMVLVEEPSIHFSGTKESTLPQEDCCVDIVVSGTTNLAPGTPLMVEAFDSRERPGMALYASTTQVRENGAMNSWSVTVPGASLPPGGYFIRTAQQNRSDGAVSTALLQVTDTGSCGCHDTVTESPVFSALSWLFRAMAAIRGKL